MKLRNRGRVQRVERDAAPTPWPTSMASRFAVDLTDRGFEIVVRLVVVSESAPSPTVFRPVGPAADSVPATTIAPLEDDWWWARRRGFCRRTSRVVTERQRTEATSTPAPRQLEPRYRLQAWFVPRRSRRGWLEFLQLRGAGDSALPANRLRIGEVGVA